MKLNLNTDNLNWDEVNIFDYRYIHHLMLMVQERYIGIGLPSVETSEHYPIPNTSESIQYWNFSKWTPNGLLTWDQLQSIYSATFFLAQYVYINPDNFNTNNFKNHSLRKFLGYSLQQLCDIANFDFFKNPFIPGQRLDYYTKFLLPLKKILSELKYLYTDAFKYDDEDNFIIKSNIYLPEKDGYTIDGPDKIDYLQNFDNFISQMNDHGYKEYSDSVLLGYQVSFQYIRDIWYGYDYSQDGKNYDGWVYKNAAYKDENTLTTVGRYTPGLEYKAYLYSTTTGVDFIKKNPSYYRSNYEDIILVNTSNVPNTGFIKEKFSIKPIDWNVDITGIPVEDFWEMSNTVENGYDYNPNKVRYYGYISCLFKPCIIVNYGNKFNKF